MEYTFGMLVLSIIWVALLLFCCLSIPAFKNSPWISREPLDLMYEYDPTGEYTYKHQNPRFR